ncbi:MAG: sulfite exporter TauE/SafE family protein [Planctomycetaceae bacterium]
MSIFNMFLAFLFNVGVMLLLSAAILVAPIFHVARSGRQWTPAGATRRNSVRMIETLQFAIGLIVLGVMWTFGSHFTWPPAAMAENVEFIRSLNMQVLVTGAVMGLIALFVTWRFSTVIGMLGLILIGGAILIAFNTSIETERMEEYERRQQTFHNSDREEGQHVEPPTTPVRIELIDQLAGADVWINGVNLGKTPIEISARELFNKVPDWPNDSPEQKAVRDDAPGNQWTDSTGKTYSRWGWCPIHTRPHVPRSTQLYFKVDFEGVPGFSQIAGQQHLQPGTPNESHLVKLDTVFPQWDQEIESLLDRARLRDYSIDEPWKTAFQSYGEFGERALEICLSKEPRIARLKDVDPAFNAMLRDVKDSASAWRLLMKIEDEARRARSYDSGSSNGLAVDEIAAMLDPQQLIDHALELLRTTRNPDPSALSQWPDGRFANYVDADNKPREEVALFPIAQAVWRLDQALDKRSAPASTGDASNSNSDFDLVTVFGPRIYKGISDAVDPSDDNLVERLLTPELLRMSYDNPDRLKYADILGGSAYEVFLLRNDWQTPASDPFDGDRIGDHSNYVNKWYARLMRLRSPLGSAFRQQQESNLLEIAGRGLTSYSLHQDLFSGALNFLFLDRKFSKDHPSLAMQFWREVKGATAEDSVHQSLQIRWNYLGRLWPESTPSMFIDVVDDEFRNSDYVNFAELPGTMPVRDQYQVLMAVLADWQKRVSQLVRVPGDDNNYMSPRQKHLRLMNSVREILYRLHCDEAAAQLLADMKAEPDHSWHGSIASFLKYDTTHEDLIRLIATGDDVKLQRDVLPAIQNHPIPERVRLLDELLKSADETIRTEAASVQTYLQTLAAKPLSRRSELRPQ